MVRTLLYRTAEWHAFAKLRLHTESTLNHLEQITADLGRLMRKFRDVTNSDFATFELPRESQARKRRAKGKEKEGSGDSASRNRKPKGLNLFTYKWHALADYVRSIRLFGGTDGFSTQLVGISFILVATLLTCNRANLRTNWSNGFTGPQTSAMLTGRLQSAIGGMNGPALLWKGSSSVTAL
jgi:hypothetical protein